MNDRISSLGCTYSACTIRLAPIRESREYSNSNGIRREKSDVHNGLFKYIITTWLFSRAIVPEETIFFPVFIGTGATSYITAPLTVPILDIILASNVTRPKKLPHSSEFFLDLEKYYYILFAITCIGYLAACTAVIAIDTIYFALLQHSCGMLAILRWI